MSDDIGGLTVACCNIATVNMMMAVGERKTQPSLICRSFLNIYTYIIYTSEQFLALGVGVLSLFKLVSCKYKSLGPSRSWL